MLSLQFKVIGLEKSFDIENLKLIFEKASNVVITCHVSPDGDAIGASLCLWHVMRNLGKNAVVLTPDILSKSLSFLPGADEIISYSNNSLRAREIVSASDLIFCLDYNNLSRLDSMQSLIKESIVTKVLIDHHLDPERFTDYIFSDSTSSSTCLLLFQILSKLNYGDLIDKDAAECVYTGMMTDTGNFTYNSSDPSLYIAISQLLERGIDKDKIYSVVCNTNSESRLRLCGYALNQKMTLYYEHKAALIVLNKEDLVHYNYKNGDTEGLVNIPLSVPGIVYSAFIREDDNYIKISMRSKGDFPVNVICEKYFNGGGHLNAAGGEFCGSLLDAVSLFQSILKENDKYLENEKE